MVCEGYGFCCIIGQALRQQGGDALQREVQRVAKETSLRVSEGKSCFVCVEVEAVQMLYSNIVMCL